jgi:hypothetical protein
MAEGNCGIGTKYSAARTGKYARNPQARAESNPAGAHQDCKTDFSSMMTIGAPLMWTLFSAFVIVALAVDNVFVFLLVFAYFAVPAEFQERVVTHERFHLLSCGLAIVLVLIGVTMALSLVIPPKGYTGSAYPFARKSRDDGRGGTG